MTKRVTGFKLSAWDCLLNILALRTASGNRPHFSTKTKPTMGKKSQKDDSRFATDSAKFRKLAKKSGKKKKVDRTDDEDISDDRFSGMHRNPKFSRSSKSDDSKKVVIDERFKAVLTDDRFKSLPGVGSIDKTGRRMKGGEEGGEMDAFYKVAEDGDASTASSASSSPSDASAEDKISFDTPEERIAYLNAVARGEIELSDEESESDFTEDEEDGDEDEEDGDGEDGGFGRVVDGDSGVLAERLNAETIEVREGKDEQSDDCEERTFFGLASLVP